MPATAVICEYDDVRKGFPQFQSVVERCRQAVIAKKLEDWKPLKFAGTNDINTVIANRLSGMNPKSGEFGESPIFPELFNNMAGTRMPTWQQTLTATGHQTIIAGSGSGGALLEDYCVGLVGLAFLDKSIRVSEIKMQISNKKLPRINIEEALAYNQPAVVFEDYFILDEEEGFELYAYVKCRGIQNVALLGVQLNRVPNKIQTTNTGVALT